MVFCGPDMARGQHFSPSCSTLCYKLKSIKNILLQKVVAHKMLLKMSPSTLLLLLLSSNSSLSFFNFRKMLLLFVPVNDESEFVKECRNLCFQDLFCWRHDVRRYVWNDTKGSSEIFVKWQIWKKWRIGVTRKTLFRSSKHFGLTVVTTMFLLTVFSYYLNESLFFGFV